MIFSEEYGECTKCEQNPNCHYKQLKCKEQECDTLISQLDFAVQQKECLEQECEELNNLFQDPEVRVALTDVRTGERDIWRKLGSKAQKYKQALDEIENELNDPRVFLKTCDDNYLDGGCFFFKLRTTLLNIVNKIKDS